MAYLSHRNRYQPILFGNWKAERLWGDLYRVSYRSSSYNAIAANGATPPLFTTEVIDFPFSVELERLEMSHIKGYPTPTQDEGAIQIILERPLASVQDLNGHYNRIFDLTTQFYHNSTVFFYGYPIEKSRLNLKFCSYNCEYILPIFYVRKIDDESSFRGQRHPIQVYADGRLYNKCCAIGRQTNTVQAYTALDGIGFEIIQHGSWSYTPVVKKIKNKMHIHLRADVGEETANYRIYGLTVASDDYDTGAVKEIATLIDSGNLAAGAEYRETLTDCWYAIFIQMQTNVNGNESRIYAAVNQED